MFKDPFFSAGRNGGGRQEICQPRRAAHQLPCAQQPPLLARSFSGLRLQVLLEPGAPGMASELCGALSVWRPAFACRLCLRQTPLWPAGTLPMHACTQPIRRPQRTGMDSAPLENDHWTILRPRGRAGLSAQSNSRDRHITSHAHEDVAGPLTPNQTRQCEGQLPHLMMSTSGKPGFQLQDPNPGIDAQPCAEADDGRGLLIRSRSALLTCTHVTSVHFSPGPRGDSGWLADKSRYLQQG